MLCWQRKGLSTTRPGRGCCESEWQKWLRLAAVCPGFLSRRLGSFVRIPTVGVLQIPELLPVYGKWLESTAAAFDPEKHGVDSRTNELPCAVCGIPARKWKGD